jgi:hypothetical protein
VFPQKVAPQYIAISAPILSMGKMPNFSTKNSSTFFSSLDNPLLGVYDDRAD